MKKTILAGASLAALLAVGSHAFAADLPGSYAPPAPYAAPGLPPVFTWTGFYVGVNVGGGFGQRTISSATSDNGTAANFNVANANNVALGGGIVDPNSPVGAPLQVAPVGSSSVTKATVGGVLGGAQVGYNYQIRGTGVVVGVETDFDGSSLNSNASNNTSTNLIDANGNVVSGNSAVGVRNRLEYVGTVRGKLGYAYDRALIYGTGGFAYGRVVDDSFSTNGIFPGHDGSVRTGYTFGGGVEYALTNSVSIKGEYLYTDLGKSGFVSDDLSSGVPNTATVVNNNFQQVRVGMNYKFGGGVNPFGSIPGLAGLGF